MRSSLFVLIQTALVVLPAHASSAISDPDVYPLSICIVSGDELGDSAITISADDRAIRLCCEDCEPTFEADRAAYLSSLDTAIAESQREIYAATTCPVSGGELGSMGEPFEMFVGNRLVKLCCQGCQETVENDPSTHLAKLDAAVVDAQNADYPADVCPISGQKLGSMGDPYNYVVGGTLLKLCCAGCVDSVNADAAAAIGEVYGTPDGTDETDQPDHGHEH